MSDKYSTNHSKHIPGKVIVYVIVLNVFNDFEASESFTKYLNFDFMTVLI